MSPHDFWQSVYIAAVHAGCAPPVAQARADAAFGAYMAKFHAPPR